MIDMRHRTCVAFARVCTVQETQSRMALKAISPFYIVSMRLDVNTYNELELSALNSLTTEKDNVESFWRNILDIILVKNYLYPTPAI